MSYWRSTTMMMLLLLCCADFAHAASPHDTMSVVSVRIHDYSRVDSQQLQLAERQVSDTYARIGVRLDWRPSVRPLDIAESDASAWRTDVAAFTIVVLAADMTRRLNLPRDVAGYAPISREHGGRVAYVMGDRTRDIADGGGTDHAQVLAGVISHELAHLMMPQRSHSPVGVMRPQWRAVEFRDVNLQGFSAAEGLAIRQMARAIGPAPSRVAD